MSYLKISILDLLFGKRFCCFDNRVFQTQESLKHVVTASPSGTNFGNQLQFPAAILLCIKSAPKMSIGSNERDKLRDFFQVIPKTGVFDCILDRKLEKFKRKFFGTIFKTKYILFPLLLTCNVCAAHKVLSSPTSMADALRKFAPLSVFIETRMAFFKTPAASS